MLPQDFVNRMREMLQEEYDDFEAEYGSVRHHALRINPLKGEIDISALPFHLTGVPWSKYGYFYPETDTPGKHLYHEAGVYYIQEPSAMLPATLLQAKPGERVLDLCAAPGGKTTQIAADMAGSGLLIANEIHPARAKILSENVERMGIRNAIVTNESPQKLAKVFVGYFDRIMVDAPCSGEGMFRKNENATEEWSLQHVSMCAKRQEEVLDLAAVMLRPGGRMVYSTCTFAPEENEGSMSSFLDRHPDFYLEEVEPMEGMSKGKPQWADGKECLEKTVRLWPHKIQGEGHFVAVLRRKGEIQSESEVMASGGLQKGEKRSAYPEFLQFEKENLVEPLGGELLLFGEQLYRMPDQTPNLKGLKVLRPGLHVGTMKKNRIEPSHALALALRKEEVIHTYSMERGDQRAWDYVNGQTFLAEGEKGWYLIAVGGYSLGWGKLAGSVMKNHYPKGLRKNLKKID